MTDSFMEPPILVVVFGKYDYLSVSLISVSPNSYWLIMAEFTFKFYLNYLPIYYAIGRIGSFCLMRCVAFKMVLLLVGF